MKKVLYVFVAIIGMLAITSCVDRQQCVGNWVSDSVTDEGFTGKFYLDLRENGTATLNIKGSGAVEEEGMNIKVQGGRIKMRSPPKVLTGNFRPSQLSFFLS